MNAVTLRHLRYFEALAQNRHFGRAAASCAISQPALSLQVKEFEEILGAPLVERGPRALRLTALGEDVAARARAILRDVDDLADLARVARDPFDGLLRLGIIPTVAPYLAPAIIRALARAHPALELAPREAVTQKLIEGLLESRLDAAVVALPVSEPALEEAPLFEEEFVLVRPREDEGRPVPSPSALQTMRLLLLEEGHCFRDQALAFCQRAPSAPRALMEGSSLSTLVQMVGAGIGVTLIPEMAVAVETRSARVSLARFGPPPPARRIGMVWRRGSLLAEPLRAIADVVRGAALAQRAGGSG
ncbi:MAG: LysR substrate-binding domain-containing protein [Rubrimonas sp.]|uniref:hydrogen peroxide-inducible genes activator n=1 Tax=Rubrimonas sp. TaxID=2036015 RepID=UPI002FDE5F6A